MTSRSVPYAHPHLATAIFRSITQIATSGNYIFRGENEYREGPVKSSLYREYENTPILAEIGIDAIQEAELSIARLHDGQTTPEEHLLHQLQHHRGKTNLIDFSEDYLIALFFACDGSPDQDGRLIFLDRSIYSHLISKPTEPSNRVEAQKSVFVSPEDGYIPSSSFVQIPIPKEVKHPILEALREDNQITGPSIYNDLHGYVTRRELTHQTLDDVARGISFYNQGHYLQAIIAYDSAIRLQPENIVALQYSGLAHYHREQYTPTIVLTTRAVRLNPYLKEAYNLRGRAHAAEGRHDQAIGDYGQAIAIDPRYAHPYNNRGTSYYIRNDLTAAISDYTTAIGINPEWVIPYVNRAAAHYEAGDSELALTDLDTAIEIDPTMAVAYRTRAQIRAEMGISGADNDLQQAASLEHDPADAQRAR